MLALSTLPHYLPIGILIARPIPGFAGHSVGYAAVIGISTTLSAVWHYLGEPDGAILYADYAMALAWSLYSLLLMQERKRSKVPHYFPFEIAVGCMNLVISFGTQNRLLEYKIWHSIWHILSAIKSIYIVWILSYS